ncbi:J domain-containing protein [Roseobacter sp.]|uniref:J domain-containing protein n=1 Tax=Roseobacter sp. TaxID=1907202 RepID=UPI003296B956
MAATPEHAARVLGLSGHATLHDVRQARRTLALKYHPDRCHDSDCATRHMARINAAVDTLVAHLKSTSRTRMPPPPQPKRAHRTRAHVNPRRAEPPRDEVRRRPADTAGARSQSSEQPREAKAQAPKAQAEVTLIRRAAASYRSALDRFNQADMAPTIDVRIKA